MAEILPLITLMSSRPKPYWLDTGTEICHGCTHSYVYQMELRCVGCDRGVCEQCVVIEHVTRETWCAECHEKDGAHGSGGGG